MTESVFIPPERHRSSRPGVFIPPLLVIPFILYNIIVFAFFGGNGAGWGNPLFAIPMISGASWGVTCADLLLIVSLVCLFIEVLKSTRTGSSSIMEHMLSMGLFVIVLLEFLLVGAAASSVFFLILVMTLIDVVAGFSVSITSAGRDVTMN